MYRVRGHLIADLDPLDGRAAGAAPRARPHHLRAHASGTSTASSWPTGWPGATSRRSSEILDILRDAYCRTLGIEYMHIQDPEQKRWIQQHVEGVPDDARARRAAPHPRPAERGRGLRAVPAHPLRRAEALRPRRGRVDHRRCSTPCSTRRPQRGRRRGGARHGPPGPAQRPRQHRRQVLRGDLRASSRATSTPTRSRARATSSTTRGRRASSSGASGATLPVTLASNPSHLEAVDPVVEGMARAKQDRLVADRRARSAARCPAHPVLACSSTATPPSPARAWWPRPSTCRSSSGYRTGGTVHVVINNQLGFTTAPEAARTSVYPTDVAKMVQAPIFHVNGDDPEACARAPRLAFGFRQAFHKDVVIDLVCYRRHGHNEGDDPSYTQPLMYAASTRSARCASSTPRRSCAGATSPWRRPSRPSTTSTPGCRRRSTRSRRAPRARRSPTSPPAAGPRGPPAPADRRRRGDARAPRGARRRRCPRVHHPPQARAAVRRSATEHGGRRARSTGRSARPSPSARCSSRAPTCAWPARTPGGGRSASATPCSSTTTPARSACRSPTSTASGRRAGFTVHDSLLSEYAALGFEYGYSVEAPDALVAWEAQFGDFANGAQIIIDNFFVAAEDKWGQRRGPGPAAAPRLRGPGPRALARPGSSGSCRCAPAATSAWPMPTTAAQYFHLLRSQVRRARADAARRASRPSRCCGRRVTRSPLDELAARVVRRGARRPGRRRPGRRAAGSCWRSGQGRLRRAWRTRDRAASPTGALGPGAPARSRSSGSSSSTPGPSDAIAAVLARYPSAAEVVLAPGGAREHGGLVVRARPAAPAAARPLHAPPREPGRVGQPGHRQRGPPPARAGRPARAGHRLTASPAHGWHRATRAG